MDNTLAGAHGDGLDADQLAAGGLRIGAMEFFGDRVDPLLLLRSVGECQDDLVGAGLPGGVAIGGGGRTVVAAGEEGQRDGGEEGQPREGTKGVGATPEDGHAVHHEAVIMDS